MWRFLAIAAPALKPAPGCTVLTRTRRPSRSAAPYFADPAAPARSCDRTPTAAPPPRASRSHPHRARRPRPGTSRPRARPPRCRAAPTARSRWPAPARARAARRPGRHRPAPRHRALRAAVLERAGERQHLHFARREGPAVEDLADGEEAAQKLRRLRHGGREVGDPRALNSAPGKRPSPTIAATRSLDRRELPRSGSERDREHDEELAEYPGRRSRRGT